MKTHINVILGIFLIMLLAAIGWWKLAKKTLPLSRDLSSSKLTTAKAQTSNSPHSNVKSEMEQPFAKTPYLGLKDPRWEERDRLREEDPSYQWRTPIEFFGKVVDENEQPVADAKIEFQWSGTHEKYGNGGVDQDTMISDKNGLFYIHGIEGKGITILVSKTGYHRRKSWNNGSFDYAAFWEPIFIEPDRNNPVLFRLVKCGIAEPTYNLGFRSESGPPAWQARFDLLTPHGEVSQGGDIILQISRPLNPGYVNPFDWQLKIEGQGDAEIFLTEEEFMLRAPDNGYQKVITKEYKQMRGSNNGKIKFYVRNKARKFYAAVNLEVEPYYSDLQKKDRAMYDGRAIINPNNSPNLEYDPKKDIRKLEERERDKRGL